jgi:hypothetical protein
MGATRDAIPELKAVIVWFTNMSEVMIRTTRNYAGAQKPGFSGKDLL